MTDPQRTTDRVNDQQGKGTTGPWLRWVSIVGGVLLGIVLLWLATNVLIRSDPPMPIWTEDDLPRLPPEDKNGWLAVQAGVPNLTNITVPEELVALCAPPDLEKPQQESPQKPLRQHAKTINEFLSKEEIKELVKLGDAVIAHPAFADACPLSIESSCNDKERLRFHQILELATLRDLLQGNMESALRRSNRLLHTDLGLLDSSRSLVTHLFSLVNVRRSLRLLERVFRDGYTALTENELEEETVAWIRSIRRNLERLRNKPANATRAIIVDYILMRRLIEKAKAVGGFKNAVFFDLGSTIREIHPYFRRLYAFTQSPKTGSPPKPIVLTQETLWWLHNLAGKEVLDMIQFDSGRFVEQFETQREAMVTEAQATQKRVYAIELPENPERTPRTTTTTGERTPPEVGGSAQPSAPEPAGGTAPQTPSPSSDTPSEPAR